MDLSGKKENSADFISRPDAESEINIPESRSGSLQYSASIMIILLTAMLCFPLSLFIGYRTVSLILLLAVTLLPLRFSRGPVITGAATAALAWNFFFIPPLFTLFVRNLEDMLMLAMFFIVAAVSGALTAQIHEREKSIRLREKHTYALYSLTKALSSAHSQDEVVIAAVDKIQSFFDAKVAVFLGDSYGDINARPHPASSWMPDEKESNIAAWTYWNERTVGKHIDTHPVSHAMYFSMSGPRYPLGVIGVNFNNKKLTVTTLSLLDNCISQIASAVERELLNDIAKKAVVVAESERLYKILFNSISHELRTPIAAIMGASENMLSFDRSPLPEGIRSAAMEIRTAAERLNRLVVNLLDMSRIESEMIKPKRDWCDVRDIVNASIKELEHEIERHPVSVNVAQNIPLIKLDFGLMEQVLTNLIHNAAVHTPEGTPIEITSDIEGGLCTINVEDSGPGIRKSDMDRIFEKFYRSDGSRTGGTGLGLPIAKGYIESLRGTLTVRNKESGGAIFSIRLPLKTEDEKI
jgi:two-component system sensor histidine kinase KdpD